MSIISGSAMTEAPLLTTTTDDVQLPGYNYAFLDELSKKAIRRALLKAVAIPGYQVPFSEKVRKETGMPTMTVGLVTDPAQANDIVASGKADMVALGRGAMWDPRFAWHAAEALGAEAQYAPKMMACHPKLRPQVFPGRAS